MRRLHFLAAGTALAIFLPAVALAQSTAPTAPTPADTSPVTPPNMRVSNDVGEIVVTARQRQESLKDIPIAVTAVTGDAIRQQQLYQVRDVAALSPGLNINSDSAGRAFVSMRGIGTTLIDTVQPGVGIFIDGIYQPNTSYLNTPLVDIARVEVLRGPQGTLFGNNTLGGAINVITNQPSNVWKGRIDGAYAGSDDFKSASGSISGPIIKDLLQFRIGGAYHHQDNFQKNSLIGGDRNPLTQKTINGSLRFLPADWATFTLNGNYDRVVGGSVPYANSSGPQDYTLDVPTNVASIVAITYKGASLKGDFKVDALHTKITAVAAYNESVSHQPTGDADFGPIDYLRASANRILKTKTGELRFDTQWSDSISTLVGLFADHATTHSYGTTTFVPFGLTIPSSLHALNESQAAFGTVFWKFAPGWDFTAGIRFDHQKLSASDASTAGVYKDNEVDPRFTLTRHWNSDVMTYASVARGSRGGGQNDPGAPNLIYRGDNVWTYEIGTKFSAFDRKLSVNADIFYNDYNHFIGANALAPSTTGVGFVAVDLNSGHVTSYGLEAEVNYQLTDAWRLYGNVTLLHERVTNSDEFTQTTGYAYAGNRVPFVPSWNFLAGTNYRLGLGDEDSVTLDANVVAKGKRSGDSLDVNSQPILSSYYLANGSIAWDHGRFEIAAFTTNLFNSKYLETYLDASLLTRAGLAPPIAANLAIQGQRRRVGVRASVKF